MQGTQNVKINTLLTLNKIIHNIFDLKQLNLLKIKNIEINYNNGKHMSSYDSWTDENEFLALNIVTVTLG